MKYIYNLKMSTNFGAQLLAQRAEFLKHLEEDLRKTDSAIEETAGIVKKLENTSEHIKFLSTKVEHEALLPIGKRIFVEGVIQHTGEYFIDQRAHPNSYSILQTTDGTLDLLQRQMNLHNEIIEKSKQNREQLEKRLELLKGGDDEIMLGISDDNPKEIVSDRGIAVRIGEFYEILEYENDENT